MNKADSLASMLVGFCCAGTSSPEMTDSEGSLSPSLLLVMSLHRKGSMAKGYKQSKVSNSLHIFSFSQKPHGNCPAFSDW